jgi:tRNA(Ile)-lysidine synthase TilS/MesJ
MTEDERFEIERALDLIPHVIGASWATTWFRLNKIKRPTKEEYRNKVVEYVKQVENLIDSFPKSDNFQEIESFAKKRYREEIEKILQGKNPEVEKRFARYLDYD